MCMFYILYISGCDMEIQLNLYCMINYLIIVLSSIGVIYVAYHRPIYMYVFCDIHLDLYFMNNYVIVLLSSISGDGFYIYVHRSLEDTLNMNINMFSRKIHSTKIFGLQYERKQNSILMIWYK
jgi:hypothetical protein